LIRVQGARENNLKDVSVEIPKRRLTVFTGVSGSGKSSLVFGTIERGAGKTVRQTFTRTGGMCPRCEGRGTVSDIDLTQLFDDSKSLAEGAITIPATRRTAGGQCGSSPSRASSTRTSRSATTPRPSCTTSSTASRPR
jgi:excinuclease UvrABC ATPase subunit